MTPPESPSDGDLLRRMEIGDEEAFADIYRRHRRSVYLFAAHMSGSIAVADDVTQETFLILIRDPTRFDPARGELRSFLLGVARNHVRRSMAVERGSVSYEHDAETEDYVLRTAADDTDPVAQLIRDEDLSRLHKSIQALPAAYRETIVLCELHEMSYDEAAEVIGCAIGTVRSRLHRARRLLEQKLREEPQKFATRHVVAGCLT